MSRNLNFGLMFEALETVIAEQTRFAYQLDEKHNNVEIVRFVENSDLHFDIQYRKASKFLKVTKKSTLQSDLYRKNGNEQYPQGNYVQALELFNKSICFAPNGSQQLSKGYANRAAVYLSLKLYDLCLENIRLAREAGYPQALMAKLDERQAKCEEMIKNSQVKQANDFHGLKPELSYPQHEKVPFIANCLDLKVNRRYGRHIVTKTDLKVGDIIAIEQPFCGVIMPDIRNNCCANCFDDNNLSLIPCSNCHSAMFCSQKCYAEAKANFHDIECPLMSVLLDAELMEMDRPLFDARELVAFRLLILLVNSFESLTELMEFVESLKNREENAFTINYEKGSKIDFIAAILSLERNEKKASPMVKNSLGLVTALFYKFLLKATEFKNIFKTRKEIDFLIELTFHLCQVLQLNSFPISGPKKFQLETEKGRDDDRICFGIYPFSSLLNHSCAPNAHQAKHGVDNVIIVAKPIKAGEQIFVSYGFHHRDSDRKSRQEEMLELYMFECDCIACVRNYPEFKFEEMAKNYAFIKPVLHMALCREYEVDVIKQLIPKYRDFLNANSKEHYPNNHTNVAEGLLMQFWDVVYSDKMALGAKQKLGLLSNV